MTTIKTLKNVFYIYAIGFILPKVKLSGYVAATVQQVIDNEIEAVVAYTK